MISVEGRINRQPYFWWRMVIAVLYLLGTEIEGLSFLVLLGAICDAFLAIGRLHDVNMSGWWGALMLVPGLNLILGVYLLFGEGTVGKNDYGPDPLGEERVVVEVKEEVKEDEIDSLVFVGDFGKTKEEVVGKIKKLVIQDLCDEDICSEIKDFLDMGDLSFSARKGEIILAIKNIREE